MGIAWDFCGWVTKVTPNKLNEGNPSQPVASETFEGKLRAWMKAPCVHRKRHIQMIDYVVKTTAPGGMSHGCS